MSSPYGKAFALVMAGTARRLAASEGQALERLLGAGGIEYELRVCRNYAQAFEAARNAAGRSRYFVAVGGDRLIHEVINGILGEDPQPDSGFVLAVVPAGRRSDFTRTFGLPADPADAVQHLGGEPYFAVDAGKVAFRLKGRRAVRCYLNLAEVGLGAGIVRRAAQMPSFLGRGAELLGFWASLAQYRPVQTQIDLEKRSLDVELCNLVVANGQFFRDGMRIAPKAHPCDGKFDVLVMKGTKQQYVAALTKARKGDHVPDPSIREYMAARVEVSSERPLEIQADGKFLGHTPATFEIVPNALRLKI